MKPSSIGILIATLPNLYQPLFNYFYTELVLTKLISIQVARLMNRGAGLRTGD